LLNLPLERDEKIPPLDVLGDRNSEGPPTLIWPPLVLRCLRSMKLFVGLIIDEALKIFVPNAVLAFSKSLEDLP
jgi:hypothetical protein